MSTNTQNPDSIPGKSEALTRRLYYLASLANQMHAGKDPEWHYETLARNLRDAAFDALTLAVQVRGELEDLPGFPRSDSA